ncbi:hypothetical protein PR202_ga08742 [Eleusine coracana subsp. coracana]|uniref:KIB1-4 beta-propeller domain-containing protein n=1 Tax=Eleusine coracana subsp. coracana TaxID=191504 RepID=A0AAV5C422_ELECO|nr:hypothetical protein QOZ80_1BG0093250 [Eleusine coracana subsp. coracana]GJM92289.1 hypothetical protein PR202_ga08742 [Eleusine coracana subsp. coracana]
MMMELPCLALYSRRDRSTSLFSVPELKPVAAAGDAHELLRNKTVCPAAGGMLLVRDPASKSTFLWDAHQGGEQIRLPPLEGIEDDMFMYSQCHFSHKLISDLGCVVLLLEGGNTTVMWYCHPGDDQWVKHEYDIGTLTLPYPEGDQYEKVPIYHITACRGKFYFNGLENTLHVLEFCPDPVFSTITVDDESCDSEDDDDDDEEEEYDDEYEPHPSMAVFHVESGDELHMVTLYYASPRSNEIMECFVDKMDFSGRRWRGVDDLGGRAFLLSGSCFGVSCSCGDGARLRQDSVFLMNPRKREMLVFDVKEGTRTLHNLDEQAPLADKAFWLLPKQN